MLTSSAALSTFLFGFAALITGVEHYEMPSSAEDPLVVASIFFALAAILGLWASWPMKYIEANPADLLLLTQPQFWDAAESIGERRRAELQVRILARARDRNRITGNLVILGMILQALGAAALLLVVYRLLRA